MPIGSPVHYLPPLLVHLTFPSTYPSTDPPEVHVQGTWLSQQQQDALQQQMKVLWEEQGSGEAICYQWLEWLKTQTLEQLGIVAKLLLLPDSAAVAGAGRGPAGGGSSGRPSQPNQQQQQQQVAASPEQVAMQVLMYNSSRKLEDFKAASWPCAICMESVAGSRCMQLPECGHVFCGGCLRQYCATLVADGGVEAIRCPEPSCKLRLPPFVLQQLLSKEDFAR
jgi:E3 ubiquitin-protein ligase RNF14